MHPMYGGWQTGRRTDGVRRSACAWVLAIYDGPVSWGLLIALPGMYGLILKYGD